MSKCFEFLVWNKLSFLLSHLCVKEKLKELRGQKFVL